MSTRIRHPLDQEQIVNVITARALRDGTGQRRLPTAYPFVEKYICTKSAHWAYEKEWRVFTLCPSPNDELYFQQPLWPEEIQAVYLGCQATEPFKESVVQSATGPLRHIEVYQGKRSCDRFGLEFDRLR